MKRKHANETIGIVGADGGCAWHRAVFCREEWAERARAVQSGSVADVLQSREEGALCLHGRRVDTAEPELDRQHEDPDRGRSTDRSGHGGRTSGSEDRRIQVQHGR